MKKRVPRTQFVQTESSIKKTSMPKHNRVISRKVKKFALLICTLTLPFMLCSCFGKEAESIILSETSVTLTVGDTKEISAKVNCCDEISQHHSPCSTANSHIEILYEYNVEYHV